MNLRDKGGHALAIILVFIAVFRLPVARNEIRVALQLVMEIGVGLALGVVVFNINRWMGAFIILATLSMIYPQYSRWSFFGYYSVLCVSVWFLAVSMMFTKDNVNLLLTAICIIALVHLCILGLQLLEISPVFRSPDGKTVPPVGLMANRNELSALLAICLPAFIRPKWWVFVPLVIAGMICTKSMGGLFAVGAGFVFYQTMKGTILLPLSLVIIVVLAYALLVDAPGFERWTMWTYGAEVGRERWLLGGGIGHWKIVMKDILAPHLKGTWCTTAHSDIFQLWFEMGVAPILLVCGYLWSIARRYKPEALIAASAIIVILASSMVHFLFHIATTGIIAVTWIAILELQLSEKGYPKCQERTVRDRLRVA